MYLSWLDCLTSVYSEKQLLSLTEIFLFFFLLQIIMSLSVTLSDVEFYQEEYTE